MKPFNKIDQKSLKLLLPISIAGLVAVIFVVWALTSRNDMAMVNNKSFSFEYPHNYHTTGSTLPDNPDLPRNSDVQFVLITPTARDIYGDSIEAVAEPAKQYKVYSGQADLKQALGGNVTNLKVKSAEIDGAKGIKATYQRQKETGKGSDEGIYLKLKKNDTLYTMIINSSKKGSKFDRQMPAIAKSFHVK
jgi:hypothetical protein